MKNIQLLQMYFYFFGALNILTSFSVPLLIGNHVFWTPRNLPTELMVGSLYFSLGVIMILVAKTAENHKALVDFLILGNILHSIIMIFYAQTAVHILLDASFIGLMGEIPLILYPWGLKYFLRY